MKTPLLSICIATYNRANMIGQTLESIISQTTDEVEIIVVDGASPDDTEVVMQRYQDQCPSLRYHRLPVKGGVDRDYCHAVSFATGEYCWLMTDDDIIKPGAINKILGLLRHKYSLIVLNAEVLEQTLINQLESRHLHIEADTFYESALREKFFIETVIYLSFIGAVVIERALWNERIKEPYIGTEFIHIGVIFQKDLPRGAYVLAEPCIAIRYGNAQWIPRHFEIWMIKWPDLIWSFPDIGETAKVQICPRSPWENLPALFVERACGAYSLPEYHKFLKSRIVSRRKQLAAKAIALSPGIIINLVMRLYFTIVALDNFILWHRLRTSRYYYRVYFNNIYLYLKRKFRFWGDY